MRLVFALLPLVLVCSCGYVGDPLPPALNIPARVTDLAAIEHADKVVLTFTIPPLTTENLAIRHLGPTEAQVGSKTVTLNANRPGHWTEEIPAREWVGQQVPIKVRLNNDRGRHSEWSNEVTLAIVEPVQTPAAVTAAADPKGVKVTWTSPARPGQTWRVLREGNKEPVTVDRPEYIDTTAEYGKEYKYSVQAVVGQADSNPATSNALVAKDIFPPAVPTGLTAIQGIDSVELNWDPNQETDLKGYRVYRSINGGAMELLAGDVETPSYSDKKVTGNQTYRYSVSSVDQVGNESGKSEPFEIKTR
jgi:hypothetical protein